MLLGTVLRAAERARRAGALLPFETAEAPLVWAGARGVVRTVSALRAKPARASPSAANAPRDAFEDVDAHLVVDGAFTASHMLLLNKFCVVPAHVLLVTREFEPQEAPLSAADVEAAWAVLRGGDWLVWFNCGARSGASQPRKHLQAVPWDGSLPLQRFVDAARAAAPGAAGTVRLPQLPFRHGVRLLGGDDAGPAGLAAAYAALMREAGGPPDYNVLATSAFVLLVPRRAASFVDGPSGLTIAANAVPFTGAFLAKTAAEAAAVRRLGPAGTLARVTYALPDDADDDAADAAAFASVAPPPSTPS